MGLFSRRGNIPVDPGHTTEATSMNPDNDTTYRPSHTLSNTDNNIRGNTHDNHIHNNAHDNALGANHSNAHHPDTHSHEKHNRSTVMSRRERRGTDPDRKRRGNDSMYGESALNKRPKFGQWLKVTWPDILTMAVMGAIGLGVYWADPAPTRSFPVFFSDGQIVYPEFAYPLRKNIIPIWAAAILASLVPIFFILLMQIRIRSFWDVNNGIIGLLYSLITAAVFQVFLKWLIGGLRPHFLAVCQPAVPTDGTQFGNGFGYIMYDRTICTGKKSDIDDSLESFPSGHTTAAFGGFVYLYLYLNAKLKVWSNYHPAYWKLIVTYMPILGATLIGGSLTIDEFHNWYDIVAGAIIGTVMAFSAYRMVYASVWDFRFNHIPLVRHIPFTYGTTTTGFDGFRDSIWTRQAGWGGKDGPSLGGAPFDVAQGGIGTGGPTSSAYGRNAFGRGGPGPHIDQRDEWEGNSYNRDSNAYGRDSNAFGRDSNAVGRDSNAFGRDGNTRRSGDMFRPTSERYPSERNGAVHTASGNTSRSSAEGQPGGHRNSGISRKAVPWLPRHDKVEEMV